MSACVRGCMCLSQTERERENVPALVNVGREKCVCVHVPVYDQTREGEIFLAKQFCSFN